MVEELLSDFETELSAVSKDVYVKALGILVRYVRGISKSTPDDPRPRSVNLENKTFNDHIARHRSGGLLFESLGFQMEPNSNMIYLRAEDPQFTASALRLFEAAVTRATPQRGLAPAIHNNNPHISEASRAPKPAAEVYSPSTIAAATHQAPNEPTLT